MSWLSSIPLTPTGYKGPCLDRNSRAGLRRGDVADLDYYDTDEDLPFKFSAGLYENRE